MLETGSEAILSLPGSFYVHVYDTTLRSTNVVEKLLYVVCDVGAPYAEGWTFRNAFTSSNSLELGQFTVY